MKERELETAAGLVEMEFVQFVARDNAARSEQDLLPAEMDGQGDGPLISQSLCPGRDVDANVRQTITFRGTHGPPISGCE